MYQLLKPYHALWPREKFWRDEGLQRRVHSPRNRAGQSRGPAVVVADAPKMVWALNFSSAPLDLKTIKIALDARRAHPRITADYVERSITAEQLIAELETCFTAVGGPPMVLRMDNAPELIPPALQSFCAGRVRPVHA